MKICYKTVTDRYSYFYRPLVVELACYEEPERERCVRW